MVKGKRNREEDRSRKFKMNLHLFGYDGGAAGAGDGNGGESGSGEGSGDKGNGAGGAGAGADGNSGNEKDDPPSFDDLLKGGHQAEFDRRVQKAIDTALSKQKSKYETLMDNKLSEADKLAKMTKEEKALYMQQKKEKELADKEAAITRRELMAEAKNTLAEKKLPAALAEVLNYADADSCSKSIDAVEKAFQEAVQAAVEEKLKGGTPPKKATPGDDDLAKQVESLMMGA